MIDLLREQEKTSFPSRESFFFGWEQTTVSFTFATTVHVTDHFGNQINVTSSWSGALQPNPRIGLFVSNDPVSFVDPLGLERIYIDSCTWVDAPIGTSLGLWDFEAGGWKPNWPAIIEAVARLALAALGTGEEPVNPNSGRKPGTEPTPPPPIHAPANPGPTPKSTPEPKKEIGK